MNHTEASNYFYRKLDGLIELYGLNKMELEPCYLNSYESIRRFTEKLLFTLFYEEEYEILDSSEDSLNVEFIFNNEKLSFDLDTKFGHIEVDFMKKIKFLGFLAGTMVTYSNPPGLLISGETDNMQKAWNEGLPIHIDEIDFLRYHYNGNRLKRSELGNKFTINRKIDETIYQENLIIGLNSYLKAINQKIRFTAKQIRLYEDHEKFTCVMINGNYMGRFRIWQDETEFDNMFLSQVFLLTYTERNSFDDNLSIRSNNGEKFEDLKRFQMFISKMGV